MEDSPGKMWGCAFPGPRGHRPPSISGLPPTWEPLTSQLEGLSSSVSSPPWRLGLGRKFTHSVHEDFLVTTPSCSYRGVPLSLSLTSTQV